MNIKSTSEYRMTSQCKVVLNELNRLKSHPTAFELYESVRKIIPDISLGTVYRNLDKLSKQGKLQRISVKEDKCRFDGTIIPHLHIRCTQCNQVNDIMDINLANLTNSAIKTTGFQKINTYIEITGICPKCQQNEGEQNEKMGM